LNYAEVISHITGAQNGDQTSMKYFTTHGFSNWQEAQGMIKEIEDTQVSEHMRRVVNGYNGMTGEEYDGTTYGSYIYAKDAMQGLDVKVDDYGNLGKVKKAMGETSTAVRDVKTSAGYKAAAANKEAVKK